MPTPDEIETLKNEWQRDPSYNIEDAVGFEEHRNELYLWRLIFETDYDKLEREALQARAKAEGRSVELQEAIEDAQIEERRRRRSAAASLRTLFLAAGLRWHDTEPKALDDVIDAIVDDLVGAAGARAHADGLSHGGVSFHSRV